MPNFIGIDLAWQPDKKHSGATALAGDRGGVSVKKISEPIIRIDKVCDFIHRFADADTVIAIDAPLIIGNQNGQRPCETEISRRFGSADAGAHTSNLSRYPDPASVKPKRELENQGFIHCPQPHSPCHPGNWFFEVYPHPAHVVLFKRKKIIKYKKRSVTSRREGLVEFRQSIEEYLGAGDPPLVPNDELRTFLDQQLNSLRGQSLKDYEDCLDSLFCGYLAAYYWAWSLDRNEMIGNLDTGYIINPRCPTCSEDSCQGTYG
jgi:predicted RNase H-like nuclease